MKTFDNDAQQTLPAASHLNVLAVLVLAQAEGGLAAGDIALIVLAVLVLIIVIFALARTLRAPKKPEITERRPPAEEGKVPTKDVLEDRIEVEEPVEITDDMSLAEIKRIKSARVKGKKKGGKRRETSLEATERARKEREEAEKRAAEEAAAEEVAAEEAAAEEAAAEEAAEEEQAVDEAPEAEEEIGEEPSESASVDDAWATVGEEAVQTAASEAEEVEEPAEEAEPAAEAEPSEEEEEAAELAEEAEHRPEPEPPAAEEVEEVPKRRAEPEPKTLAQGLQKTRSGFIDRLSNLFSGEQLEEDLVDDIEEVLFTADIGPRVARAILQAVEEGLSGEEKKDPSQVWDFIRDYTSDLLERHEEPLQLDSAKPFVMVVIGVNGVGKTTTIGKMASKFRDQGKKVLLVAADTFRAGAVDQLAIWAERTDMPIHQGEDEADPSSVLYEGIERGIEEDVDVILCDTSGRLHTNVNLMDELAKMGRVAGKAMEGAPHETMLVLDANTGQNAIAQAKKFNEALDISGIALTKLDGTARGGVILGICDELESPVRYIGIGESVADLREFDADEFVEALFM